MSGACSAAAAAAPCRDFSFQVKTVLRKNAPNSGPFSRCEERGRRAPRVRFALNAELRVCVCGVRAFAVATYMRRGNRDARSIVHFIHPITL